MTEIPQWICKRCGRALDDHQQHGADGRWHPPMCLAEGDISHGIRHPTPKEAA